MTGRRGWVALAVALALGASSCATPSPKEIVDRAGSEPTADEVLEGLAYDPGDVLPNEDPIDLGAIRALDEPTLSLCGGDFPSEAHRVDRRTRTVFPKTESGLPVIDDATRIIVTRYEPGQAKLAMDQLAMAAATCDPERYVDEGTDHAHRTIVHAEDPALVEGLAPEAYGRTYQFVQQTSVGGEQALEEMIIAQRRGDLLVIVDGHPVRVPVLAANLADRLAALDPADVGE